MQPKLYHFKNERNGPFDRIIDGTYEVVERLMEGGGGLGRAPLYRRQLYRTQAVAQTTYGRGAGGDPGCASGRKVADRLLHPWEDLYYVLRRVRSS